MTLKTRAYSEKTDLMDSEIMDLLTLKNKTKYFITFLKAINKNMFGVREKSLPETFLLHTHKTYV